MPASRSAHTNTHPHETKNVSNAAAPVPLRNADLEAPVPLKPLSQSNTIAELVGAVCGVMGKLGPIAKTPAKSSGGDGGQKRSGLPYEYLSEDAITATLRPLLSEAGLAIIPRGGQIVEREDYEAGSSQMTRIVARQRFLIVHKSGEFLEGETWGEAADSGDKVMNKVMTAAFKYFERQTFAINGGSDPDTHHSDDVARTGRGYASRPTQQQQTGNRANNGQQNNQNQQRANPNQQTGAAAGNNGGKPANPKYPNGTGSDDRAAKLIEKIDTAPSHGDIAKMIEWARGVEWSDAQRVKIRTSAAARRVSFWSAAIDAAPDLEAVDSIQADATPALKDFAELGKLLQIRANNRRQAITAAQEAAYAAGNSGSGDGSGDMPFADTPVEKFDF